MNEPRNHCDRPKQKEDRTFVQKLMLKTKLEVKLKRPNNNTC